MLSHAAICGLVAASYSEKSTWVAGDDIRAVGSQQGDEYVVAVPGTTDLQGWLDDFSFWPTAFPMIGPYHDGFGKWGLALAAMVLPALPAIGRVVFAGHSLGGQLAQVMAAIYHSKTTRQARVVVFGCPRGALMTNIVAGPLVRAGLEAIEYRNAGDPVPETPPWPMWKHNAKGVDIGAPSLGAHAMALYLGNLQRREIYERAAQ